MANKFWVVWNPDHGQPRHRHDDIDRAKREAERLARHTPGVEFIVLESVEGHKLAPPPPPPITVTAYDTYDPDLPF